MYQGLAHAGTCALAEHMIDYHGIYFLWYNRQWWVWKYLGFDTQLQSNIASHFSKFHVDHLLRHDLHHVFTDISAFSWHQKECKKGKRCLSSALDRAKEVYQRKRTWMDCGEDQPWIENGNMGPSIGGDPLQINLEGSLVQCHEILVHLATMPYLPLLF